MYPAYCQIFINIFIFLINKAEKIFSYDTSILEDWKINTYNMYNT